MLFHAPSHEYLRLAIDALNLFLLMDELLLYKFNNHDYCLFDKLRKQLFLRSKPKISISFQYIYLRFLPFQHNLQTLSRRIVY